LLSRSTLFGRLGGRATSAIMRSTHDGPTPLLPPHLEALRPLERRSQIVRETTDLLAYAAARLAFALLQTVPLEACRGAAWGLARVMWHVLRVRRKVVQANLEIAFPAATPAEREAIALAMWEHLVLMAAEIAQAPRKIRRSNWRQHSQIPDLAMLVRQLLSDRPTVLISGHLGNFEMGGYLLGLHGFATHTVARPLDNRRLHDWINGFRGATGQYILPREGSGLQIDDLLASGGTLVLLGDQHASGNACWVDFFGKLASTHKAVAVFPLRSGAPTAVCGVLRRGKPLEFELLAADLVDPEAPEFSLGTIELLTAWYTNHLEGLIRKAPGQYWWLHRRWKGDPEARRRQRKRLVSEA
jgi:Kdo2-lipid IVA lauroyltransferase/acyltransferase